MSDTIKNANPFGTLIASVLKNAKEDGNTLSRLIVAMYEQEVSYSREALFSLLSAKPEDRRAAIHRLMSEASEDFAALVRFNARVKDKDAKPSATDKLDFERNRKAMSAAETMFRDALASCFALRAIDEKGEPLIVGVAVQKEARGLLVKYRETDAFGDPRKEQMPSSHLKARGNKMIADQIGKATRKSSKPNAIARARQASFEDMTNLVKRMDIDTLNNDEAKAFDNLLAALIGKKLVADNLLELSDVADYVKEAMPGVRVAK